MRPTQARPWPWPNRCWGNRLNRRRLHLRKPRWGADCLRFATACNGFPPGHLFYAIVRTAGWPATALATRRGQGTVGAGNLVPGLKAMPLRVQPALQPLRCRIQAEFSAVSAVLRRSPQTFFMYDMGDLHAKRVHSFLHWSRTLLIRVLSIGGDRSEIVPAIVPPCVPHQFVRNRPHPDGFSQNSSCNRVRRQMRTRTAAGFALVFIGLAI